MENVFYERKSRLFFVGKTDNSIKWHDYKHSPFEDLKEISDFSYLRSRVFNRTVTNFPQLQ